MNKLQKMLASAGTTLMVLAVPAMTLAVTNPFDTANQQLTNVGTQSGVGSPQPLPVIVGRIINVVLGFLGILLLVYLLYAGFLWMTAAGDDKQVGKAKEMIKNAVIGLIVIVAAFSISNFVLSSLVNVTTGV